MKQIDKEIAALEGEIKPKKMQRLKAANEHYKGDDDWTYFTPYHWATFINGKQLDYWPTANKWQFAGMLYRGNPADVEYFIHEELVKSA